MAQKSTCPAFSSLAATEAAQALAGVGIAVDPAALTVEPREERWVVRLPHERLAWFAASETGREVLRVDSTVLRQIEEQCRFQAPRILVRHASGDFDVRAMVSGASDAQVLHAAACNDPAVAREIGESVGSILSELHTRISIDDADPAIQRKPSWPESQSWILERLPRVIDDRALIAKARELLSMCDSVQVATADLALIHGDLGMHALAYDPQTFRIHGIFDFEGAAIADRHHDFRYLGPVMLDAAMDKYRRLTGITLDRQRIYLYGAACALTYLAFRDGHSSEERWCGRTLREDLEWTKEKIAAIENFSK